MTAYIKLLGRVFVTGDIRAVTGLHVGGAPAGLAIGGLDNPVIRDARTGQPYIPGSSLKGKMRSLSERARGFNPEDSRQVQKIGQIRIHVCQDPAAYAQCDVCQVFGLPGEMEHSTPTRLTVRDVFLDPASLEGAQMDYVSTEIKWEASIDRITSAALPRQIERVPAGALFAGFEMVFSLYDLGNGTDAEFTRLTTLVRAMQLLEDDYLGGLGSRGSGKVRFENVCVALRKDGELVPCPDVQSAELSDLVAGQDSVVAWAKRTLAGG